MVSMPKIESQDASNIKIKSLWAAFVIYVGYIFIGSIGIASGRLYNFFAYYLSIILLVIFLWATHSVKRGLMLILLASATGFIAEYISLSKGTLFGAEYVYNNPGLTVFTVPSQIIVFWGVFIYLGYKLINSFVFALGKELPNNKSGSYLWLLALVVLDGLVVVAIDLFMDPLFVHSGMWSWRQPGVYFGIPIGNFIGWFGVTIIATGVFRFYEYYHPVHESKLSSIDLLPVLGYLAIGLVFFAQAISYNFYLLAIVGTCIVIIPSTVCLILLCRNIRSPDN